MPLLTKSCAATLSITATRMLETALTGIGEPLDLSVKSLGAFPHFRIRITRAGFPATTVKGAPISTFSGIRSSRTATSAGGGRR